MLSREVVKGQQLVPIFEKAFGGLWIFRLEYSDEQIEGGMRIFACLGLPNVVQHLLGFGLGSLGQVIQHIASLMHPTPLLAGRGKDLFQRRPESHDSVAGGQFRGGKAATSQGQQHLAPALLAFPDAIFNGQKVLFAPGINADHDKHAEPVIGAAQATVDTIRPYVDPFVATQIRLAPVVVFRRSLRFQP